MDSARGRPPHPLGGDGCAEGNGNARCGCWSSAAAARKATGVGNTQCCSLAMGVAASAPATEQEVACPSSERVVRSPRCRHHCQ
eukprot:1239978-Alexandrium_andersonii.AAC.1